MMVRAYLIEPRDQTIADASLESLSDVATIIGASTIMGIGLNDKGDRLNFASDLPAIPSPASFRIEGYHYSVPGSALVTGGDHDGGLLDPAITLDALIAMVSFPATKVRCSSVAPIEEQIWESLAPDRRRSIRREAIRGGVDSVIEARKRCFAYIRKNLAAFRH